MLGTILPNLEMNDIKTPSQRALAEIDGNLPETERGSDYFWRAKKMILKWLKTRDY
jgi:hypothetical protein